MLNYLPKKIIILAAVLTFFILPCFSFAQTETRSPFWKIFDLNFDITQKAEKGEQIKNREGVDIASERTMFSKTFANLDGSFTKEIYPNPINYLDDFGIWKPIDVSIVSSDVSGYDFMNETNLFKTYFTSDPFGNRKNVKYQIGDASMEFDTLNSVTKEKKINSVELKNDFRAKRTRKLLGLFSAYTPRDNELGNVSLKNKNQFKYPKIVEDVINKKQTDVTYSVSPTKLLEEIILNKYESVKEISQEYILTNVYVKKEGNVVNFYNFQTNNLLWHLSKPVMYEFNARIDKETKEPSRFENYDLHFEIEDSNANDNKITIKKVLDEKGIEWLDDWQRRFPVVIDATTDYDFNTTTTNKAYYKSLTFPAYATDTTAEAGSSDYSALATSDDSRWSRSDATTTGQYDSQVYKFTVNEEVNSISSLYSQWEGYGEAASGTYYTYFKIWDNTNATWTNLQTIDFNNTTDQVASGTISSNIADYINSSSEVYFLASSQKAKNLGEACSSANECTSGFCVDSTCCNNSCTGSTCQTCGEYSNAGAGTCSYSVISQDPDSECPGAFGACTATTCSGSGYACAYLAAGEQGQSTCKRCSGSSFSPANVTDNTEDNEGSNLCEGTCYACQSGSCSWATASTDPDDDCTAGSTCSDGCNTGLCGGSSACQIASSGKTNCPGCGTCSDTDAACEDGSCTGFYSCNGSCTCVYDRFCPFIYSWNGLEYIYDTPIIYKLDSKSKEALQFRDITKLNVEDDQIKMQIREEEPETSYIDYLYLEIVDRNGKQEKHTKVYPFYASRNLDKLLNIDENYLITNIGDIVDLRFDNVPLLGDGWQREFKIAAKGYYIFNNSGLSSCQIYFGENNLICRSSVIFNN